MKNNPLSVFKSLNAAVIDASSIIYMMKAGFFDLVAHCVQFHAPESCLKETGFSDLPITGHSIDIPGITADQQLLMLAQSLQLPVVSEDRKVLITASRNGITFYNSLMMLNFLLYKKSIEKEMFTFFLKQLTAFARYSEEVFLFGKEVTRIILDEMDIE
jgi:hypothetical protein